MNRFNTTIAELDWEWIEEVETEDGYTDEERFATVTFSIEIEPETEVSFDCAGEPGCTDVGIIRTDGNELNDYERDKIYTITSPTISMILFKANFQNNATSPCNEGLLLVADSIRQGIIFT